MDSSLSEGVRRAAGGLALLVAFIAAGASVHAPQPAHDAGRAQALPRAPLSHEPREQAAPAAGRDARDASAARFEAPLVASPLPPQVVSAAEVWLTSTPQPGVARLFRLRDISGVAVQHSS